MSRNKLNQTNIDNSDPVNFPDGRIKNNTGAGDGTPVNEQVYGDIHETFAKLMRLAGLSYNSLADSEGNGYQFISALTALASKNDYLRTIFTLGTTGKVGTNIDLDRLQIGESFIVLSSININFETILQKATGGQTGIGIELTINYKGTTIKSGDYVRLVITSVGCDLIKLADGDTFNEIATTLGYLQAATQGEEDTGAIDTKATTPLTNFTAFADRVIGAASTNFLATQIANGLLSAADKLKLDNLDSAEKNYGTFGPVDVNTGSVGNLYTRTGDVTEAKIVSTPQNGQVVEVILANAMSNTNYEVNLNLESLGTIYYDNDIYPLIFKIISSTKIQIFLNETAGVAQSLKIHISTIQR